MWKTMKVVDLILIVAAVQAKEPSTFTKRKKEVEPNETIREYLLRDYDKYSRPNNDTIRIADPRQGQKSENHAQKYDFSLGKNKHDKRSTVHESPLYLLSDVAFWTGLLGFEFPGKLLSDFGVGRPQTKISKFTLWEK